MADWDDDDYEEAEVVVKANAGDWSGEDDDDDVKDAWDDDSEDEAKPAPAIATKKKPLKERIAEREAKKKAELEEKKRKEEEERKAMTPEEIAAEKVRARQREEDDQLMLAKELMGVSLQSPSGIESMNPQTAEEFTEFSNKIKQKLSQSETHPLYTMFLEDLFRDLCVTLNSESTKKIGSALTTLANEKQKMEKASQAKGKKKKGPSIKVERTTVTDYEGGYENDFDDFM
ncbi:eukaryotic translation initiation factor 3 subunit J-A-like [Watersipora subatra]|uniref:eukaryotic translation initiation factor 3 subunit J-A-like n=1 Tax=Watersipora subatra TaxID=2589382 RepID=UPI00355C9DFD